MRRRRCGRREERQVTHSLTRPFRCSRSVALSLRKGADKNGASGDGRAGGGHGHARMHGQHHQQRHRRGKSAWRDSGEEHFQNAGTTVRVSLVPYHTLTLDHGWALPDEI